MNPISKDIVDILEGFYKELNLSFSKNLFISREPAEPANCVTIYDPPSGFVETTNDERQYSYQSFQVRIRSTSYEEGFQLAYKIVENLKGWSNGVINGTYYASIQISTPPASLGWDDRDRHIVIINYETQRR